jgi:two-component system, OmpR family, sensor histidine kinase KdpD
MRTLCAEAHGAGEPSAGTPLNLTAGELSLSLRPARQRAIGMSDRAVLEALASGLATALAYHRLETDAAEARLAAEVNRTRSGFLSAVSHNLKTPLAAIKTAVSALLEADSQLDPEDHVELLETIRAEGDHLERLVTKVLNLSRIRAGGLQLDLQEVDLADLARAAARRMQPLTRTHQLCLDLPDHLPEVRVDVTMLEQVFLNLLENALRYAPPGSQIMIATRQVGAEVEARVIDHGCGVPPDQRERIFEAFYRGEGTHETSGTGLGLAIVSAVVDAHHGRVWCEQTPGGGATFAFRLPLEARHEQDPAR